MSILPALKLPVMDSIFQLQPNATDRSLITPFTTPLQLDLFPDIMMTLSADGMIKQINKAGEMLLGYTGPQLAEQHFCTYVFPNDTDQVQAYIERVKAEGSLTNFTHRVIRKDGAVCYISWSGYWLEKEQQLFSIGRDVSSFIENQQKQIAKEQLFQALIDNSFDLLALTDEKGKYLYVSDTFNNSFGYQPGDMLGTNCFDYMHPDDLPRLLQQFQRLFEEERKIHVPPYRFRNANGEWLWMEAIVTNQLHHPGINGIVVSVRDINQQYHNEMKLKEMQLLQALVQGEEKE